MNIEIYNTYKDEYDSKFFDVFIDGVAFSFNTIDDSHRGAYPYSHYRHKNNPNKLQDVNTQIASINKKLAEQDSAFEFELDEAIRGCKFVRRNQDRILKEAGL
jgi:hypothetical protein